MSDKLKDLESELEKLVDKSYGRFEDIDKAFNLGMQIANELNRLQIKDYKIECLEQKRTEEDKKDKFRVATDKINKFLEYVVKSCIREHVRKVGSWTIEKATYYGSNVDRFDGEITSKYGVQFAKADLESYGGDFEVEFEVLGELKEVLEKHDLLGYISGRFNNSSGEEEETVYDEDEAEYLYNTRLDTLIRLRDADIEKIEAIASEIEKIYVFKILARE
jgi:hypothetical protein